MLRYPVGERTIKTRESKIGKGEFPGGRIAFTFTGHARKAQSAIDACTSRLRNPKSGDDVFAALEQVLEVQYRRLVHKDPGYGKDGSLDYWLILSVWIELRNRTFLWATSNVSLYEPTADYSFAGIGLELGYYIATPAFNSEMSEEETLFLAVYMMARVSDNAHGVGGMSHYLSMHHDGSESPIMGVELTRLSKTRLKVGTPSLPVY